MIRINSLEKESENFERKTRSRPKTEKIQGSNEACVTSRLRHPVLLRLHRHQNRLRHPNRMFSCIPPSSFYIVFTCMRDLNNYRLCGPAQTFIWSSLMVLRTSFVLVLSMKSNVCMFLRKSSIALVDLNFPMMVASNSPVVSYTA